MENTTTSTDLRREAKGIVDEAARELEPLATDAKQEMRELAANGRDELDRAAQGLLGALADQLENLADEIRGHDLDSLLEACESTARTRPELYFAGSVAAGFAMSRFAKASALKRAEDQERAEARNADEEAKPHDTALPLPPAPPANHPAFASPAKREMTMTAPQPRPTRAPAKEVK